MGRFLTSLLLFLLYALIPVSGQGTYEDITADIHKAGGVYFAYDFQPQEYTPAPEGFVPFYISHYGRHGSRWLLTDKDYISVMEVFRKAEGYGFLTPFGNEVYARATRIYEDGLDRAGELTPLGARQHKEISARMYSNFPGIFTGNATVDAVSTTVVRCVLSMAAFCEGLKENNPSLDITRDATKRTTRYLNFFNKAANPDLSPEYLAWVSESGAPWREGVRNHLEENLDPERLMSRLFSHEAFSRDSIDAYEFMSGLFFFAADVQDTELDVDLYYIFTTDEMYRLWEHANSKYYFSRGAHPKSRIYSWYYAVPLLEDFIERANKAVASGTPAADLRFGHDGNIMAFTGLFALEGCTAVVEDPARVADVWADYRITPMAANLQLVFYRDAEGEVLVKFLHNEVESGIPVETPVYPYYRWKDVEEFYNARIKSVRADMEALSRITD